MIGAILLILGILFLLNWYRIKKQKEKEKNFILMAAGLIYLIWFFPGITLALLGLILIFVL